MHITKFTLKNVGLHKDLTWETPTGVLGILGANGSGKTTLLYALEFLLCGNLKDYPGKKEDLATWGADESYVEGEFSKGGQTGVLRRYISHSKRSLTWNGETITSDKGVQEKLQEILGVDKEAFRSTKFIRQGELKNALFGSDAVRRNILMKYFNVNDVTQRHDQLDRILKNYKDRNLDDTVYGRRDALREELNNSRNSLVRIQNQIADLNYDESLFEYLTAYREASKQETALQETLKLRKAKREEIPKDLDERYKATKLHLDRSNEELSKASAEYQKLTEMLRKVQEKLTIQNRLKELETQQAELAVQIETANKWLVDAVGTSVPAEVQDFFHNLKARFQLFQAQKDLEVQEAQLKEKEEALKAPQESLTTTSALLQQLTQKLASTSVMLDVKTKGLALLKQAKEGAVGCTGDKVECPKCNLKVFERQHLSDQELALFEKEVEDLRTEHRAHTESISTASTLQRESQQLVDDLRNQIAVLSDACVRSRSTISSLTSEGREALDPDSEESIRLMGLEVESAKYLQTVQRLTIQTNQLSSEAFSKTRTLERLNEDTSLPQSATLTSLEADIAAQQKQIDIHRRRKETFGEEVEKMQPMWDVYSQLTSIIQDLEDVQIPATQAKVAELEKDERLKTINTRFKRQDLNEAYETLIQEQKSLEGLRGELRQVTTSMLTTTKALEGVEVLIENQRKHHKVIERLSILKAMLEPNGIVRKYLQHRLYTLHTSVSEMLSLLDANFVIRPAKDELSYQIMRIDKPEAPWLDMHFLSGGQKVKLALAFLIAVQQEEDSGSNFMVLDEPSTHLDREAKLALGAMLTRLATTLSNGGGQCWVVDHEQALQDAFTHTSVLGPQSK